MRIGWYAVGRAGYYGLEKRKWNGILIQLRDEDEAEVQFATRSEAEQAARGKNIEEATS